MTLWRRTRNEAAGAWRSLRYDLGRRDGDDVRDGAGEHTGRHEVTSTGLHTFAGPGVHDAAAYATPRHSRRLLAATALGTMAVAGAAGSYVAVAGLGGLSTRDAAGAEPYPLTAGVPGGGSVSNEGLGRGSAPLPRVESTAVQRQPPVVIRTVPVTVVSTTSPAAGVPVPPVPTPARVEGTSSSDPGGSGGGADEEPCDCSAPPVPTPTAGQPGPEPQEPSATPSTDDSPSPSPSAPDVIEEKGGVPVEKTAKAEKDVNDRMRHERATHD